MCKVLHGGLYGRGSIGQKFGSSGRVKPLCRLQKSQRTLLFQILHQGGLGKLLGIRGGQFREVSLVLGE